MSSHHCSYFCLNTQHTLDIHARHVIYLCSQYHSARPFLLTLFFQSVHRSPPVRYQTRALRAVMGAPSALVMRDAHAPCRIPTRLFAVLEGRAFSRRRGHGFLTVTLAPESERRFYPHAWRAWDIWVGKLSMEKHASSHHRH